MGQEIQQDVHLVSAAVPQTLLAEVRQYVRALGFFDEGCELAAIFAAALNAGLAANDIAKWSEEYYFNLKGNNVTPYYVFTMLHDAGQSLTRYLFGRAAGLEFGSPVEETKADRAKQVANVTAQLAAKEAAMADASQPQNWDPDGIAKCRNMLIVLATKPLYHVPTAPGPGVG